MPAVETVTIINKSGKIVSTGKHFANIFKDAKAAYQDKKNELKAEYYYRAGRHSLARLENGSVTSSRPSRPSRRSSHHSTHLSHRRHRELEDVEPTRPPLTSQNLSYVRESSIASSSSCQSYRTPLENPCPPYATNDFSYSDLPQRYTTGPAETNIIAATSTLPPPYASRLTRSRSNPDLSSDSNIDMNLAYGHLPYDLMKDNDSLTQEQELNSTMDRLDILLLEAECLQSSAAAIISHLQAKPDAMAAVALALAELSTIVAKMGPSVLRTLKMASPAIFALLASPQFLIATGVAMGVTVVMLGGFQIIKKIRTVAEEKHEAEKMESPMAFESVELESIKSWRRGVADADALGLYSSADEEYITPEAVKRWRERISDRRSESSYFTNTESFLSDSSSRTPKYYNSLNSSTSDISPSEASSRSTLVPPTEASSKKSLITRSETLSRKSRGTPTEADTNSSRTVHSKAVSRKSRAAPSEAGTEKSRAPRSDAINRKSRAAPSDAGRTVHSKSVNRKSRASCSEADTDSSSTVRPGTVRRKSRTAPSEAGTGKSRTVPSETDSKKNRAASSEAVSKSSRKSHKSGSDTSSKVTRKKKKTQSVLSTIFEPLYMRK